MSLFYFWLFESFVVEDTVISKIKNNVIQNGYLTSNLLYNKAAKMDEIRDLIVNKIFKIVLTMLFLSKFELLIKSILPYENLLQIYFSTGSGPYFN